METRYYQAQGIDIDRLADDLEQMLIVQGDQVQHFGDKDQMTVQVKKGSDIVAFLGLQSALTLTMQRVPGGVIAMIGQQKWVDKAAVGAVGMLILWPLAFTAGAGAIQQAQLGGQVMKSLDMLVRQQVPNVVVGQLPANMMPGAPTQFAPPIPPEPTMVPCTNCNTLNDKAAKFCLSCGQPIAAQEKKLLCPDCGAELKPNAAFCSQCGTSLLAKSA